MPPLDLLSWPAVREAEAAVVAAQQAWTEAQRRYHFAPHGKREARLKVLQEAAHEALRAGAELARLRREHAA